VLHRHPASPCRVVCFHALQGGILPLPRALLPLPRAPAGSGAYEPSLCPLSIFYLSPRTHAHDARPCFALGAGRWWGAGGARGGRGCAAPSDTRRQHGFVAVVALHCRAADSAVNVSSLDTPLQALAPAGLQAPALADHVACAESRLLGRASPVLSPVLTAPCPAPGAASRPWPCAGRDALRSTARQLPQGMRLGSDDLG